jgi:hypothetical protein
MYKRKITNNLIEVLVQLIADVRLSCGPVKLDQLLLHIFIVIIINPIVLHIIIIIIIIIIITITISFMLGIYAYIPETMSLSNTML